MSAKHMRSDDVSRRGTHAKRTSSAFSSDAAEKGAFDSFAKRDRVNGYGHGENAARGQQPRDSQSNDCDGARKGRSARDARLGKRPNPNGPVPRQMVGQQAAPYRREDVQKYRSQRKMAQWKKALAVVASVFALCVVAVGGYALWYSGQLNAALSMGEETDMAVNDVLVAREADKPFYMLLLGSDSREGSGTSDNPIHQGDNQRSDVMILARVDAKNKQVTMVSIPRDTPLTLDDGSVVKLNEAYNIGGAAYSIQAVSNLTGVPVTHYAEIHFSEFQELVDKLGGVEVDVPVELSYKDALTGETVTLEPGDQTLTGQQAQIFARARHEYGDEQDAKRQNNVRVLLEAIIEKVLSKPFYELPNTVLDLAGSVGTDMDSSDLVSLALEYAGGSGKMTIYSCTGPTDGDINKSAGDIWLCYENPEGWKKLMAVVDAGEDPSGLDVNSTAIIPPAA